MYLAAQAVHFGKNSAGMVGERKPGPGEVRSAHHGGDGEAMPQEWQLRQNLPVPRGWVKDLNGR